MRCSRYCLTFAHRRSWYTQRFISAFAISQIPSSLSQTQLYDSVMSRLPANWDMYSSEHQTHRFVNPRKDKCLKRSTASAIKCFFIIKQASHNVIHWARFVFWWRIICMHVHGSILSCMAQHYFVIILDMMCMHTPTKTFVCNDLQRRSARTWAKAFVFPKNQRCQDIHRISMQNHFFFPPKTKIFG